MLKRPITYTDFNGTERTVDCYFNLTQAEIMKMEAAGFSKKVNKIIEAEIPDANAIVEVVDEIVAKSYGVRTDNNGFVKRVADLEEFMAGEVYSALFMELVTDADALAAFINGVIPEKMLQQATAATTANNTTIN